MEPSSGCRDGVYHPPDRSPTPPFVPGVKTRRRTSSNTLGQIETISGGLSRSESDGALLVVYHASKTTEISVAPVNTAAAATPTGVQYAEKASLVVEMLDAASATSSGAGTSGGVPRYSPGEIAAQVNAAVEKLLELSAAGAAASHRHGAAQRRPDHARLVRQPKTRTRFSTSRWNSASGSHPRGRSTGGWGR
jgi:hypothetical protein